MTDSSVHESQLVVEVRARTGARTVIAVAGEVDMSNSAELRRAISELISRHPADRVALDLSELTFMGSAGIRVLLEGQDLVEEQGGQLKIIRAHEHVVEVLAICGLTDLFRLRVPKARTARP